MAPKKLSESDKQDILDRYRQSEETTTILASHYGVSTSTISRILKQNLPEQEYEGLVQQKRAGTFRGQADKDQAEQTLLPGLVSEIAPDDDFPEPDDSPEPEVEQIEIAPPARTVPIPPPQRRQRKRLILNSVTAEPPLPLADEPAQSEKDDADSQSYEPTYEKPIRVEVKSKAKLVNSDDFADLEEEGLDQDEDLEDGDLDDEDLEDEDLDEDGVDLVDEEDAFSGVQISRGGLIQVLPLSEANMPRTCYVVVDRASELITRPLKDFADLGHLPNEETQAKTLPLFDNHRVAKRFLRRMQRIVKVPDTRVFQKVRPYLQAKGITRLLIDGQIYSL
jgi:transposase-like protein